MDSLTGENIYTQDNNMQHGHFGLENILILTYMKYMILYYSTRPLIEMLYTAHDTAQTMYTSVWFATHHTEL